ncbi:MAG: Hsp20/alpha crystallin family protein [Sphingomonas oligoaromativorans]|jgi:HSP20 family protein
MTEMMPPSATDRNVNLLHSLAPAGWLRSEIDRLFDDFARPSRSLFEHIQRTAGLPVAIEMARTDKEYRLTAELPGLTDKDIEVTIADNVLSIVGHKRNERQEEEDGLLVSERRYGAFRRQLPLPSNVDADHISATVKHGILTVSMPKDAKASKAHRRIEIGRD